MVDEEISFKPAWFKARALLYLNKKNTMKRMQHEKTWIQRENRQVKPQPAAGVEPNPPILRQLLDDYDSQNHCL
jgi:hypothetical protein